MNYPIFADHAVVVFVSLARLVVSVYVGFMVASLQVDSMLYVAYM